MGQTKPRQSLRAPASRPHTVLPDTWNLTDLLEHRNEDYERLLKELDSQVSRFEVYRDRLHPDIPRDTFQEILRLSETIAATSGRLSAYAYLWFSEDTKEAQARTFKSRVEERLTGLQNRMLFFDLWWQRVEDAQAQQLLEVAGDLRYHLETIRRFRNHTLSEPEEKILNVKNTTGRSAVQTIYDVITNGFSFTLTVNGKRRTLTREELSAYVRHPNPRVREAAYKALYRVFRDHQDVLGEIYAALVQDWKSEQLDLRNFDNPIAPRDLGNDVPSEAVTALLAVCAKNAPVFQEYFRLKARLCRIKLPLSRYHIYAPHRADRKRYRYADGVRMVLDAYAGFSPHLADLARRVIEERHIHARTAPGKLSGAYCYSVLPDMTPYVFVNYTGEARDIATLAHELGHAVHGMMAESHSVFTFHATLPLAETASVFGERILSDALMNQERSKSVRQGLLMAQLDDIYATVLRQAYFIMFEKQAHELVANGATAKDLAAAYLANLRDQFGQAVVVPEEFQGEWLTIPHIFSSPFYCYAYSFGNLLVLALYHMYREQGPAFVPKYLDLLAAGGSKSPEAILAPVGIDIRSEAFWQSGFDTIRTMVEELEHTVG